MTLTIASVMGISNRTSRRTDDLRNFKISELIGFDGRNVKEIWDLTAHDSKIIFKEVVIMHSSIVFFPFPTHRFCSLSSASLDEM